MFRLVPELVRQMGEPYPELVRGAGADHRDAQARGDALPQDAGEGPRPAVRCERQAEERRRVRRRRRLQAVRHVRLSGRPDAGCAEAARHQRRHDGLRHRHAEAEGRRRARPGRARARPPPKACGSRSRTRPAPAISWATRPRSAEGEIRAIVKGGKAAKDLKSGEEGRAGAEPDSVLRRVRRPDRRHGAHQGAEGRAVPRHRYAEEAGRPDRACGHGREGLVQAGRCRRAGRRPRAALGHARQPFGDPSAARGAAPGAGHARGAEGLDGGARASALRLLASQADERRGGGGGRGHGQRHHPAECAGRDAPDGDRGRHGDGRHGAVRREVRRRGARRVDGRIGVRPCRV